MTKVKMSTPLGVPAQKVWDLIGGINTVADWHPAVEKSELEQGGTIRKLSLVGGGEIVEKLTQTDDEGRTYSYSIVSSPLPVAGYNAEIRVTGEGDSCNIEWSSNFEPNGASETDATEAIQGIYQAGFDNLKKMFNM